MSLTMRGHTSTWQCCCSVGVVSITICGQYVRWDMYVTAKCVLLPRVCLYWQIVKHTCAPAQVTAGQGYKRGGRDFWDDDNQEVVFVKFLWAYSFWGQWCVSRREYASRYGRDQHVGCVTYELRIHTTHARNLPQVELSKFQSNISIGGLDTKLFRLQTLRLKNTSDREFCFVNLSWNFADFRWVQISWIPGTYTVLTIDHVFETFYDVDDWIFHSLSLCLSQFSVHYLHRFVTVRTVKKMWTGGYVSYFTACPSESTFFRQSTTRKKRTEKSRRHLLRRDSDSEKNLPADAGKFFL